MYILLYTDFTTMQPVLTRYLYHRDEVSHSLLTCLLLKPSFKEALFWASEIYYSGYHKDIWELLWKIYYDFFASFICLRSIPNT